MRECPPPPLRDNWRRHRSLAQIGLIFVGCTAIPLILLPVWLPAAKTAAGWLLLPDLVLGILCFALFWDKGNCIFGCDDQLIVRRGEQIERIERNRIAEIIWSDERLLPSKLYLDTGEWILCSRPFNRHQTYVWIHFFRSEFPEAIQVGWPRYCQKNLLSRRNFVEPDRLPSVKEIRVTRADIDRKIFWLLSILVVDAVCVAWLIGVANMDFGMLLPVCFVMSPIIGLRFLIPAGGTIVHGKGRSLYWYLIPLINSQIMMIAICLLILGVRQQNAQLVQWARPVAIVSLCAGLAGIFAMLARSSAPSIAPDEAVAEWERLDHEMLDTRATT